MNPSNYLLSHTELQVLESIELVVIKLSILFLEDTIKALQSLHYHLDDTKCVYVDVCM